MREFILVKVSKLSMLVTLSMLVSIERLIRFLEAVLYKCPIEILSIKTISVVTECITKEKELDE